MWSIREVLDCSLKKTAACFPCRSPSRSPTPTPKHKAIDLSRTQSFRTRSPDQRVFRASDLLPGEVLGKGFFGQAIKVSENVVCKLRFIWKQLDKKAKIGKIFEEKLF